MKTCPYGESQRKVVTKNFLLQLRSAQKWSHCELTTKRSRIPSESSGIRKLSNDDIITLLLFIFVLILHTWSLVFHLLWNEIVGVINAGEVFGESFGNPREGETSFPREREDLGAAREREARNKTLATGITVNIVGFKSDWTDKDCFSSNVFLLNLKQTCLILDAP